MEDSCVVVENSSYWTVNEFKEEKEIKILIEEEESEEKIELLIEKEEKIGLIIEEESEEKNIFFDNGINSNNYNFVVNFYTREGEKLGKEIYLENSPLFFNTNRYTFMLDRRFRKIKPTKITLENDKVEGKIIKYFNSEDEEMKINYDFQNYKTYNCTMKDVTEENFNEYLEKSDVIDVEWCLENSEIEYNYNNGFFRNMVNYIFGA